MLVAEGLAIAGLSVVAAYTLAVPLLRGPHLELTATGGFVTGQTIQVNGGAYFT
jgi:hypothetical protein